jgi:predicted molibdopterin-dependent oxidoreductase YjgC
MSDSDDDFGLRVPHSAGVVRGERLVFHFDGRPVPAFRGESVAAALMAAGIRRLRTTPVAGAPRGVFCAMGVCYDCLVTVDGTPSRRACLVPAAAGMRVETQAGHGGGR